MDPSKASHHGHSQGEGAAHVRGNEQSRVADSPPGTLRSHAFYSQSRRLLVGSAPFPAVSGAQTHCSPATPRTAETARPGGRASVGRTAPSRQPSPWNRKQKGAQKSLPPGHIVLMTWARDLSLVTSHACWAPGHIRPVLEVSPRPRVVPATSAFRSCRRQYQCSRASGP